MLGASGVVKFAPMKTKSLTFTFTPVAAPLQISDVVIPGVPFVTAPTVRFTLPCGFGPQLAINGTPVPTKVSGTFADLLNGRPMRFTACSPVPLAAGANQVTEPQVDAFDIQDVVLSHGFRGRAPAPAPAGVVSWTSSVRKLRVAAATRSYLVVNENFNPGWRAVMAGRPLQPVRLDGWKQAWVLPPGSAGLVTLTYQPESMYRDAVTAGLAALALVMLAALGLRRRPVPDPRQWPQEDRSPGRFRWLGLAVAGPVLAGGGLVLGGYPGAILVPASALAFVVLSRRRDAMSVPWVLGGLLLVAAACGAVGEHLALSGDIGSVVSAPATTIPQTICLIVFGGMAAALLRPAPPAGE
jgi:arabinofuranan 3-O-arabinosyltransferase